jgi:DNA polymerase/3'-5' exonuclease PolX
VAFKANAYRNAAKAISAHPDDVLTLDRNALEAIPHVGPSSAALILEYANTGAIAALDAGCAADSRLPYVACRGWDGSAPHACTTSTASTQSTTWPR